jgi:hypothetical protein
MSTPTLLRMVLLVGAFICFILATTPIPWRVNLQSLGLALWVLAVILG